MLEADADRFVVAISHRGLFSCLYSGNLHTACASSTSAGAVRAESGCRLPDVKYCQNYHSAGIFTIHGRNWQPHNTG